MAFVMSGMMMVASGSLRMGGCDRLRAAGFRLRCWDLDVDR